MKRRFFLSGLAAVGAIAAGTNLSGCTTTPNSAAQLVANTTQSSPAPELTVFRSPTCNCCGKWIDHMEAAGFQIKDEVTEDMDAIKQQYGVPDSLSSCHTGIINGYVVEGHVPAEDVQRLLAEQPNVAGIAAPGMPMGSPGMDSGDTVEPYTVFSFTEDGNTAPFAEHS